MIIRNILLALITLFLPHTLIAFSPPLDHHEEYRKTLQYANQVIALWKMIGRNSESPLLDRIILQREALANALKEIYTEFDFWFRWEISLDISHRYDFSLQQYKLSCEIVAIRMIIEGLTDRTITEDEIISKIKVHSEPLSKEGIWWDPDIGFVGSITGSQYKKTGYGIYEKPLSKYLKENGLNVGHSTPIDTTDTTPESRLRSLLESLEHWNLIMLWWDWCTSPRAEDGILLKIDTYIARMFIFSAKNQCDRSSEDRKFSWSTLSWKKIDGLSGEHVFLLLGYIWSLEKPSHIIVWDTDTGKHFYPYGEWMRKWSLLEYRSLSVSL